MAQGSETPSTKILIVEDVDEMRELLRATLGAIRGFQISGVARNTWEARLEISRRRPDIVLLDEILPGESSWDLVTDLKDQQIPVIAITGMSEPTGKLPPGVLMRLVKPSWDTSHEDQTRFELAIRKALLNETG